MTRHIQRTILATLLATGLARALPENGQVIQGNLQITQPQNHILQILQSSPTGIINWGSFNIDANQLVQFLQPGATSALLNRVVGQDPSQILGQIQANGRIFLVNPNGVLFGPGSSVNAGSFLATTLSIQDQDFIQGRYNFYQDPNSALRAVVNQGEIHVTDGGFIALISPLVNNEGLLVAQQGQVVLGATTQATLQVDARGLLQVSIPDGFQSHSKAAAGSPQTVLLTQAQMSDTLAQLVRGGQPEGERLIETAQGFQLVGGEGLLVNQGEIRADATRGQAGSIRLDSSQATLLTSDSLLSASSANGDGGSIYALSAGATIQNGAIQARSLAGGNGGFAEVSGRVVQLTRGADLSAAQGRPGQLLIDPDFITIVAAGGTNTPDILFADFPGASLTVDASALDLPGTTVTLQAEIDLSIDPGVQVTLTGATDLVLSAHGSFVMGDGSAIIATDPAASVTISAVDAFIRDLQLSNINIQAGNSVQFNGTTVGAPMMLGRPGGTTVLDVTAGTILHTGQIEVVGNHVQASENSTGPLFLNTGANVSLLANTANVSLTGGGAGLGVVFSEDASLRASSAANIILASPTANVNFQDRSSLNLAGPSTVNITTPAGAFFLFTGSSINATDPASVVNVDSATAQLVRSNLRVPTSNLATSGTLSFVNATVGGPGLATVVNASSGTISLDGLTVQGNSADIDLASTGQLFTLDNSTMHVQSGSASVNMTAQDALVLATNSSLLTDGPANVHLTSNNADVFLAGASRLDLTGPSSVDINAPVGQVSLLGTINATNPASTVNVSSNGQLTVGLTPSQLIVPTSNLHSNGLVQINNTTVGVAGSPTVFNVTANGIAIFAGSDFAIQGSTANITLDANTDIFWGQDGQTRVLSPTANLVATANTGIFVGTNTRLSSTGAANFSLATTGGDILLREGSALTIPGTGDVHLSAPGGRVIMTDTSTINATGTANLSAQSGITVANLRVPTSNLTSSTGSVDFQNSVIGRDGGPTVLNVSSPDITFALNSNARVLGSQALVNLSAGNNISGFGGTTVEFNNSQSDVNMTAPQNLRFAENTSLSSTGVGNFSFQGGNVTVDGILSAPGSASRADLTAVGDLAVASLQVPTIALQATNLIFDGSPLGRSGLPTQITANASTSAFFIGPNDFVVQGNSVNFQLTATQDIFFGANHSLTVEGDQNQLRWQAGHNNQLSVNSTISAAGATRLDFSAGANLIQQVQSSLSLPNAGSNVSLQSNGTLFVNQVNTGGNLSATVTAGNVRLSDQLAANNLTLNVSGELIAQPGSRRPALVGSSALNVSAGRISGPFDEPESGLVQSLAFATGPNAQVRFNVTGTNNASTGNRAANLFYLYPQSGSVVVTHPSGEVLLVNEPPPPVPPPTSQTSALATEVVEQANQSISVLIHPFLPSAEASTAEIVFLDYRNAALVQDQPVSLSTALLERAVTSPDAAPSSAPVSQLVESLQAPELKATQAALLEDSGSFPVSESTGDWQGHLNEATVEVVVLLPERSASEVRRREDEEQRERATNLLIFGNDEDAELLFWRRLIEGIILWEE